MTQTVRSAQASNYVVIVGGAGVSVYHIHVHVYWYMHIHVHVHVPFMSVEFLETATS